ncbi:DNA-binding transcriptional regulator, LysR family [Pseudomonas sp. NFR09]|uniref:LysR family transcriptional regulator n=1 Tax=Pseudomonas sp. NFR09 TaxID=1566249 RepID=UPI0008C27298|nr:LysR family transcriptional regulator [Pseudomonas sp. NFR09]SEU14284.1 DNA-binding transcriptional regulator, LysR family [Pseudomonas sp. NFR09]
MSGHRLPSLGGLRAFESAARLGRMSLAAHELCVTPGAVSRSIRRLEQEMGVTLFSGPKGALRLTVRGEELAAVLTDAFGQIVSSIGPYQDDVPGALQLSCPSSLAVRWLIPRLSRLQQEASDIQVHLTTSNRPIDFLRGAYDVAIRLTEHAIPDDARVSRLFPEFIGLVGPPHLLGQSAPQSQTAHSQPPVLCSQTRPGLWERWAEHQGVPSDRALSEFENLYYVIEAAKAGLGVCVAPWPMVVDDLDEGRLMATFGFIASGHDYIVARRKIRSNRIERLCEWLVNEAREMPQPDSPTQPSRSGLQQ